MSGVGFEESEVPLVVILRYLSHYLRDGRLYEGAGTKDLGGQSSQPRCNLRVCVCVCVCVCQRETT